MSVFLQPDVDVQVDEGRNIAARWFYNIVKGRQTVMVGLRYCLQTEADLKMSHISGKLLGVEA